MLGLATMTMRTGIDQSEARYLRQQFKRATPLEVPRPEG
jgi:hypothetical protein